MMNNILQNKYLITMLIFTWLATLGCTNQPKTEAPSQKKISAKVQSPESVNDLLGKPEKAPAAVNAKNQLPPGHPPISGNQKQPSANQPVKVHGSSGRQLPPGHPAVPGHPTGKILEGPNKDSSKLKAEGAGSQAELDRTMKSFLTEEDRNIYRQAFVNVFNMNRAKRNPVAAEKALLELAKKHPKNDSIYRLLGYAAVDNGFQVQRAMQFYGKAIELNPENAEVHYALAFMYAMNDRKKGVVHYQKAMSLGLKDERGIGPRFYPEAVK